MMLASAPAAASDGLVDALNEARSRGCDQRPGVPPLQSERKLDRVARLVAEGREMRRAMSDETYRAVKWTALHIADGRAGDAAVAGMLAERFCAHLTDAAFSDVGIARSDGQTWFVLAAPFAAPAAEEADAVGRRVLELTNAARASPRNCGGRAFAAARPLGPAPTLDKAARAHARDMAAHSYFAHQARDGSNPGQRAARAGYRWRAIGENIAAGPATAEAVVSGWLGSPEHCANLMGPRFAEMGIAFAVNPASRHGMYWVQLFGAPR
jgi:uncharacterized protein YkwD